jgi:hypothetical protein
MVTMCYYFMLRWLNQDSDKNHCSRREGGRRPSLVPRLLTLEDRTLPSTLTVLNNADSGAGSLRAAIITAQNGDQIVFDQSLQGQTITLTSGELAITKSLDIEGLGADQLAVSGNHASRIFDISSGTTVTIAGLMIMEGMVAPATSDALGGGILNNGSDITLEAIVLQSNVVRGDNPVHGLNARGGGLYSNGGSVTIADSTIAGNQATGGRGGYSENGGNGAGVGIYATGASLTITDSAIADNRGIGGTGGMGCNITNCHRRPGDGGTSQGGGLYLSAGMLTLTDSTIADNTLQGGYGGSFVTGTGLGGSGGVSQGGGLYLSGAMLTVADSTIADNAIQGGEGVDDGFGGWAQGGGCYISGPQTTLTVSNSTIASNTARGGSGGSGGTGQGGGLWVGAGVSAQVIFSTIAINQAVSGSGYNGMATGGGVFNVQGMLQTRDTLLAGNTVNGPGTNSGPDVGGDLGSLGHNLVGNSQGGSGFDATDLLDVDPLLGPLQDNGGLTQTTALLPGSPAIDAGDNTGAPDWDQRGPGYPRIVNGIIDIGAFEYQGDGSGRAASPVKPSTAQALAVLGTVPPLSMDQPAEVDSAMSSPVAKPGTTDRLSCSFEMASNALFEAEDRCFTSFGETEAGSLAVWSTAPQRAWSVGSLENVLQGD